MLRSQQYINEGLTQLNEKLILNPLELLAYELQSKDINSKKQSIENVQIIALAMSQKDITNCMLPFLMKMMVEENIKELKLSILKSLNKILPLLSKQKSYLKMIEILMDVAIVFEQAEIRREALQMLDKVLFDNDVLEFEKVKQTFKGLIMIELKQITEAPGQKNAKQVCFYLIKYFFHKSEELTEDEVKELIKFINKFYVEPSENNDWSNIKIFAQNLNLLVPKWPKTQASQLDSYINLLTGVQASESSQAQINYEQQGQECQKVIEKPLKKQNTVQLPKQVLSQTQSSIIPALIAYGKHFNIQKAHSIMLKLLQGQNSKPKIELVKRSKQIFQTFNESDLSSILDIFKGFKQQSHDMKKAIIEVIDEVDLDQTTKSESIIKNCKNTVDLKNILVQSLIRSGKSELLGQVLTESDYDFKVKIFMKLSDSLLHRNVIFAEIVDSLLSDPKKNFRSKLNVILNIITRIQDNVSKLGARNQNFNLEQTFDVSYLIRPLVKYFGDRVAVIRVNVAKVCALIIRYLKVDCSELKGRLDESFEGQKKSWFERQCVLIMFKEYFELCSKGKSQSESQSCIKQTHPELMGFIKKSLKKALQGIPGKLNSSNCLQKVPIINISLLASEIINLYSIQQA